jgi:hypothetical protein
MLRAVVAACLVWALALPPSASAGDRAGMLSSLRPAARADLPLSEIGPLSDLPLYDLDLSVSDDLTGYALRETIELTNTSAGALSELVLRLFGNSGSASPAITLEAGRCTGVTCTIDQPRPSVLRVRLAAALAPGAKLALQLRLRGHLRVLSAEQTDLVAQGIQGLGALLSGEQNGDYGLLSFGDGIASLAHFYAVLAQRKGSSWVTDEQKPFGDLGASGPSFVRAAIHAPQDVVVVSSGVVRDASTTGTTRTQHIDAALVRDFAVVASRGLRVRSRAVGDVTVRAYSLAPDADGGGRALDAAASALEIFERRFGPYPYADLDVVEAALVGGAGGCEFSGLVTVASMLYRPPASGVTMPGSMLEFTTAHEVAHQYWYGLVGSDARAHPFQDESLAQWSAALYFEDRFGAERGAREADTEIATNYRVMRMLGQPDGRVERPVDSFDSALSYAGLVYGKGPYLYPALRKVLGDEVFFDALRAYTRQYRFQTAPPTALFARMSLGSGRADRVRTLVQHWLVQRHGDHDLGSALAAVGGKDQARLRRLVTALLAPAPATSGDAGPKKLDGKPGSDVDLEQLRRLLGASNLGPDAVNVEQLQSLLRGVLPGASPNGDVDPAAAQKLLDSLQQAPVNGVDAPPGQPTPWQELQGEPNQRGM